MYTHLLTAISSSTFPITVNISFQILIFFQIGSWSSNKSSDTLSPSTTTFVMFFISFSVKNDHSMSFDVLITKYSGVVHTIQTFDRVVSQYETSLLQSSRGAIHAIFETFVSKNEIVLSSNFA